MVDHKSLSEDGERSFKYWQQPYIDIDIDFYQLWGKTVALIRWFNEIGEQRIWDKVNVFIIQKRNTLNYLQYT